eukprot:364653-Chlamydomonas_euryale.AAC.10
MRFLKLDEPDIPQSCCCTVGRFWDAHAGPLPSALCAVSGVARDAHAGPLPAALCAVSGALPHSTRFTEANPS